MNKNVKKRYWAFVLYPESAPNNWKDLLIQTGLPIAISPLHDKDVNPDNTKKKDHYHIIICWDGPTTYNNVKSFTNSLNQPIPQPLESIRGYYRYFIHKDNPEKYQYNEELISTLNGFDVSNYLDLNMNEKLSQMRFIFDLIRDNNINEFYQLIDLINNEEVFHDFFHIVVERANVFNYYLKSYRHSHIDK